MPTILFFFFFPGASEFGTVVATARNTGMLAAQHTRRAMRRGRGRGR